jgi:hypothetical protein
MPRRPPNDRPHEEQRPRRRARTAARLPHIAARISFHGRGRAGNDIHSRQGRPAGHCRARTTSPEVANTVERTVTELAGRGYRALAVARSGDGGKTWAARTKQSVKALPSAFAPQAVRFQRRSSLLLPLRHRASGPRQIIQSQRSQLFGHAGCSALAGKQRTSFGQLPVVLSGQHLLPASAPPEELR